MPELPEVETTRRGLLPLLLEQKITKITLRRADLRFPLPPLLAQLKPQRVTALERRAKYILLHLANKHSILVHLGMSGRLTKVATKEPFDKHDHVIFTLSPTTQLRFNDPRRFGLIDYTPTALLAEHKLLRHLGAEPLERGFCGLYLHHKLQGRTQAIKIAIMDQRLVVGVGNIYASEALYLAKIDPRREAGSLTRGQADALAKAIKTVLARAIDAGGSSLRDYVQTDGALGFFQNQFAVYDRKDQPCPNCSCKTGVQQLVQAGRSTYYCAHKQK